MNDTPATRRINHGRGHSYLLDGSPVQGVTTILSDGIPKKALVDWAARETAAYAVDHWDELCEESPSKRLRTLEQARWESSRKATARGTDVHDLALRLARGEEVDVPEPLTGHVDAYLKFADDWHPDEILVEVPVFHRQHQWAGTLDLIARLADSQSWLIDWKTTASGVWPETAVQLAAYRRAEFYIDQHGSEHPLPDIDRCGVVWLRADGYDLYPVDAGESTYRLFRYAQQVAGFAHQPKERFIGDAQTAPAKEAA